MAIRTAAPDDPAPLGMLCCGRRGAWTDNRSISQIIAKRYPVNHLGVDPVVQLVSGIKKATERGSAGVS